MRHARDLTLSPTNLNVTPNAVRLGDKVTRAEPFASQVNVGNVDFVRGAWNNAALKELEGFPDPREHDDIVDSAGRAFRRLLEPSEMQLLRVMGL